MSILKELRKAFRNACYKRDEYCCAKCGMESTSDAIEDDLDAHHICDRHYMPNDGYTPWNGISLCGPCHEKAEAYHVTGTAVKEYSPSDLYKVIASDYHKAIQASFDLVRGSMPPDYWQEITRIGEKESFILMSLDEPVSAVSWELACAELGLTDPLLLKYGHGRYVDAADRGTEGNHPERR